MCGVEKQFGPFCKPQLHPIRVPMVSSCQSQVPRPICNAHHDKTDLLVGRYQRKSSRCTIPLITINIILILLRVKWLVIVQLNTYVFLAIIDIMEKVLLKEKTKFLLLQAPNPPLALEHKKCTLTHYKTYVTYEDHRLNTTFVHSHL